MNKHRHSDLISIIVPIYNAEATIANTLQSVQQQSYPNWEALLVIDSNSQDMSEALCLKQSQSDPRFKLLRLPNKVGGVAANRNWGVDQALGQFICFIDADDLWKPEKLMTQLSVFANNSVQMSCHGFQPIGRTANPLGSPRLPAKKIGYYDLLKNNEIGCSTVMIRKSFLGKFRFENIKHEDLFLWLKLTRDGAYFLGLEEVLSYYRISPDSLSGNKLKSISWRFALYQKLGLRPTQALYYFFFYIFTAIKKRL